MDNETSAKKFESVYSTKVRAGKRRTYFFDVRQTKGEDYYLTLTESTRRFNSDGYERHKIFLYKEDFNRFLTSLTDAIDHVKNDLMPDYDYDEFTKRQEEWEAKIAEENANAESGTSETKVSETIDSETNDSETNDTETKDSESADEEMSW